MNKVTSEYISTVLVEKLTFFEVENELKFHNISYRLIMN